MADPERFDADPDPTFHADFFHRAETDFPKSVQPRVDDSYTIVFPQNPCGKPHSTMSNAAPDWRALEPLCIVFYPSRELVHALLWHRRVFAKLLGMLANTSLHLTRADEPLPSSLCNLNRSCLE